MDDSIEPTERDRMRLASNCVTDRLIDCLIASDCRWDRWIDCLIASDCRWDRRID